MTDDDLEFDQLAEEHDFSELQAEFLRTYLSRPGHSHTVDQIEWESGASSEEFANAVADIVDDYLDEDND